MLRTQNRQNALSLLAALFLQILLLGCTSRPEPMLGKSYYSFSVENTLRLRLMRNYEGEAVWSMTVARNTETTPFAPEWVIESAPVSLRDRYADTAFIQHFLDTLRTLTPKAKAKEATRARLGLEPPRSQIEWTYRGQGGKAFTDQVLLGNQVSAEAAFARFAILSDANGVYEVEGAALRMLDYAHDWNTLRYKTVALWTPDDVDLIEGPKASRFERAGLEWDAFKRDKRTAAVGIRQAFQNLMHQRMLHFLDSDQEQSEARELIRSATREELTLRTRKGHPQTLELYVVGKKGEYRAFLRNSLRGDTFFEGYPEIIAPFRKLNGTTK